MKRHYYSAVIFYVVALLGYITYQYTAQRTELIASIDKRLIQCASVADQLLPSTLHTPQTKAGSITQEEDRINRLKLSRFSQSVNVKYVYSFVLEKNKVYFTSSSATPQELKYDENLSYFFDEYPDASEILFRAFKTQTIQFDETIDQWGHFRSVFLPHVSPSGRVYITAADIEISNIDRQLHALLMSSLGEALFYLLILIPFFIAYRIQNKGIQKELSRQVAERTAELEERSIAVERLLNNANQGFLTFSTSLVVDNEYSQKCIEIFGNAIDGENITDLLYPDDRYKRDFLIETLDALFKEVDTLKAEAIISLLPSEFIIANRAIHIDYKRIETERFMLILTDITDKRNLEKNIEKERQILKMVVSAISNSEEFFELLEEYQNFLSSRDKFVDDTYDAAHNIGELYRSIHTFKGLFSQKDFITTPQGLHKLESKLSEWLKNGNVSNEMLQMTLNKIGFEIWLAKDLDILKNVLGDEFLEKKTTIVIDDATFESLNKKISQLVEEQPEECHDLLELLEVIHRLKYKPIGDFFLSFPKYAESLGERLGKTLNPMEIDDDTELLIGEEFKGFAKSLIHVIRNSVDHGIETPEERVESGKDEYGMIYLLIRNEGEFLRLEIVDDGRGIDIEKLRQKAIADGIKKPSELVEDRAVLELLFQEYFSTKEEVTEFSGRGVGLSSVRAEILKLGGEYHVETEIGKGSRFVFSIPKASIIKDLQ